VAKSIEKCESDKRQNGKVLISNVKDYQGFRSKLEHNLYTDSPAKVRINIAKR
jgi:hypothetical protein